MLRNEVHLHNLVYWTTQEYSFRTNWYANAPECRLLEDILDSHRTSKTQIQIYGVLTKEGIFKYVEPDITMRYRKE